MKKNFLQDGYIALISAIIIAGLLLIVSVAVSFVSFSTRFNVLDAEFKRQSTELAEDCLGAELLRLSVDPADTRTGNIVFGNLSCSVFSVQLNAPSPGQVTIQTKASYNQAVTNVQASYTLQGLQLLSWQELPTL